MATLRDVSHYTTISTSEQPLSSTTEIVTGESESESSYVILVSVAIIPRQPLSSVTKSGAGGGCGGCCLSLVP